MPTPEEITRHHDDAPPPGADPWVNGPAQPYEIAVVEYDHRWPADFERLATRIRGALDDRVLELHHVGSTSVPGLPAKPVIRRTSPPSRRPASSTPSASPGGTSTAS